MVTRIAGFLWRLSFLIQKKPIADSRNFFLHNPARTFPWNSISRCARVLFPCWEMKVSSKCDIQENKGKIPRWGEQQCFWAGEWDYPGKYRSWNRYTIEFSMIWKNSGLGTENIQGLGQPDRCTTRETYSRPDFVFSQ